MATKMITLKLDEKFLDEIDSAVKDGRYHDRTEFIRASLRKNLDEEKMREAMKRIAHLKGAGKGKLTDEEYERMREEGFDALRKGTSKDIFRFLRL